MTDKTANQDNSHDLYAVRLQKLENLCKEGRNPFQANCAQTHTSGEAVKLYKEGLIVVPILFYLVTKFKMRMKGLLKTT